MDNNCPVADFDIGETDVGQCPENTVFDLDTACEVPVFATSTPCSCPSIRPPPRTLNPGSASSDFSSEMTRLFAYRRACGSCGHRLFVSILLRYLEKLTRADEVVVSMVCLGFELSSLPLVFPTSPLTLRRYRQFAPRQWVNDEACG